MFKTLFRRKLRETFSGFIFLSALSVLTILIPLSAYIQARYYRSLVEDYALRQNMHQAENDDQAIVLSRPLPPLLPFFNGVYDSLPDEFRLQNDPPLANPLSGDLTPLDWLFPKIDLGFIIGALMTLIAVLLAHNTIASEKEQGTLRLILASPLPRRTVLAAKLASILLPISAVLVYTVSLYTLIVAASSGDTVVLTAANLSVLALYTMAGLLVLMVFAALGTVVSVSVRHPSIGLVVCLSIWVISVLVWPSLVPYIASSFKQVSTWQAAQRERALKEGELIRAELAEHREMAEELKTQNAGVESAWPQYLELRRKWMNKRNEEIGRLNDKRKRQIRDQRHFTGGLVSLSPYAIFNEVLGSVCETGLESYDRFLASVGQYGQEEFQPASFLLLSRQKSRPGTAGPDSSFQPRPFQAQSPALSTRLRTIGWSLSLLIAEGILLLVISILNFEHYDVGSNIRYSERFANQASVHSV